LKSLVNVKKYYKNISRFFSIRAISGLGYLPEILNVVKNWQQFLLAYLRLSKRNGFFLIKNNVTINYNQPIASGTVIVVYIRKHYGIIDPSVKCIVDIGANIGVFMTYAASMAPQAKIYCYEPNPDNYELLNSNISSNNLSYRVSASCVAVGAKNGIRHLNISSDSPRHSIIHNQQNGIKIVAECISLDEIINSLGDESVDILKMNCEGAEYEIFYNTSSEIYSRIKNIRMEFHDFNSEDMNGRALESFLIRHGYSIVHYDKYDNNSGFLWADLRSAD
jgi:FkbM family methyltransferase